VWISTAARSFLLRYSTMDSISILTLEVQMLTDLAVRSIIVLISRPMSSGKAKVTQIGMEQGRVSRENV
jgi:hypothetical protein